MKTCPECQMDLSGSYNYCPRCGMELVNKMKHECLNCGQVSSFPDKFCGRCGSPMVVTIT